MGFNIFLSFSFFLRSFESTIKAKQTKFILHPEDDAQTLINRPRGWNLHNHWLCLNNLWLCSKRENGFSDLWILLFTSGGRQMLGTELWIIKVVEKSLKENPCYLRINRYSLHTKRVFRQFQWSPVFFLKIIFILVYWFSCLKQYAWFWGN